MIEVLDVDVSRQGLYDITAPLCEIVSGSGVASGLVTLFIQHTSASLLVQENYDGDVRRDLEAWLNRLVPEGDLLYTHRTEGPDDMPAHVKSALTAVSLGIPVLDGRPTLGTWQGVFVWEHRHRPGTRRVLVHIAGE